MSDERDEFGNRTQMQLFEVTYSNRTQASESSRAPPCWHSERSKIGGGGEHSLKKQTYKSVLFLCSAEWEALTKSAQNLPPQDGPTKLVLRLLHSLMGLKKERRVDLLVEAFRLWVSLSVCLKVVTSRCVDDNPPGFRGGLSVTDHTPSFPGLIQPVLLTGCTSVLTWTQDEFTSFSILQSCWRI